MFYEFRRRCNGNWCWIFVVVVVEFILFMLFVVYGEVLEVGGIGGFDLLVFCN